VQDTLLINFVTFIGIPIPFKKFGYNYEKLCETGAYVNNGTHEQE